jgi:signal transduction histidine kinase
MNKTDSCRELEKGFLATFLGELLPGVLHNFANPLNGIMGRSKLLQRRLADTIQKLDDIRPGFAKELGEDKIIRDINSIATEAERFFEIFRDLAGKISTLASPEPERINLSRMIDSEVRFADFYLDFKHDIRKNILLDENLPWIMGNAAHYSLCMSAFINSARERMKKCTEREISITSSHDSNHVHIVIQDNGTAISDACKIIIGKADSTFNIDEIPDIDRVICHALFLMIKYGALVYIDSEDGCNKISLAIPYRQISS